MKTIYLNATDDKTWYRIECAQDGGKVAVRVCANWRDVPSLKLENLTQVGYELMQMCRTLKAQEVEPNVELKVSHVPEKPGMLFFYYALMGRLQRSAERLPPEAKNGARKPND